MARMPSPLHATIEEFAAEGYTHVECFCPRCRVIRLRPMSWLPRESRWASRSISSHAEAALSVVVRFSRSSCGDRLMRGAELGREKSKFESISVTFTRWSCAILCIQP